MMNKVNYLSIIKNIKKSFYCSLSFKNSKKEAIVLMRNWFHCDKTFFFISLTIWNWIDLSPKEFLSNSVLIDKKCKMTIDQCYEGTKASINWSSQKRFMTLRHKRPCGNIKKAECIFGLFFHRIYPHNAYCMHLFILMNVFIRDIFIPLLCKGFHFLLTRW